jgi:cold shock CspA family protein/ribosome-associated translation inhibitor RaiA
MQVPIKVVYRNLLPQYKESIEDEVRLLASKLDKFHPGIISCRVAVEMPHKRRHDGNLFKATITVNVPDKQIVVSRENPISQTHENIYVAVRRAFDDAIRQLEEYDLIKSRNVKDHDLIPHGIVSKLFKDKGYGFIESSDGREIYFHENSAVDGFGKLKTGTAVRFEEEEGEKGPQASSVKILRKVPTYRRRH